MRVRRLRTPANTDRGEDTGVEVEMQIRGQGTPAIHTHQPPVPLENAIRLGISTSHEL